MTLNMAALAQETYHAKPWALVRRGEGTITMRISYRMAFLMDRAMSGNKLLSYKGYLSDYSMAKWTKNQAYIYLDCIEYQWKKKPTLEQIEQVVETITAKIKEQNNGNRRKARKEQHVTPRNDRVG